MFLQLANGDSILMSQGEKEQHSTKGSLPDLLQNRQSDSSGKHQQLALCDVTLGKIKTRKS